MIESEVKKKLSEHLIDMRPKMSGADELLLAQFISEAIRLEMIESKYTGSALKRLLSMAFIKGEEWGKTYTSWFTPSREDHNKNRNNAITEILNKTI